MSSEKLRNIGIICPEKNGYNYCKKIISFKGEKEVKGRKIAGNEEGNYKLYAINSGTGKIKSASGTQLLIDKYDLDLIIDSGSAFSLSDNVKFYSVIMGMKAFEYDVFSTAKIEQIPDQYVTKTLTDKEKVKDKVKNYLNNNNSYNAISLGNIASGEEEVDSRIFRGLLNSRFNSPIWSNTASSILKTAEINEVKTLSFRVVLTTLSIGTGDKKSGSQKQGYTKLYNLINDFINDDVMAEIYSL
ncbi:MAG: hypothetical protein ACOCP5_04260 [Halanaerobiaceae bacterium]